MLQPGLLNRLYDFGARLFDTGFCVLNGYLGLLVRLETRISSKGATADPRQRPCRRVAYHRVGVVQ
jgi:hypothetical protein